jgi:crotonobetainyl-CoA:carnitine CoA-transferase CaiB-like acyl-CoA transferase
MLTLAPDTRVNRAHYACTARGYQLSRGSAFDRQSGVPIRVFGVVPKMSLTPGRIWRGAPSIGDDTTDILSTMLGLSHAEIDGLYVEGIVHRTAPFTEPQVAPANP